MPGSAAAGSRRIGRAGMLQRVDGKGLRLRRPCVPIARCSETSPGQRSWIRNVGDLATSAVKRGPAGVIGVRGDDLVVMGVDLGVGNPREGLLVGVERRNDLDCSVELPSCCVDDNQQRVGGPRASVVPPGESRQRVELPKVSGQQRERFSGAAGRPLAADDLATSSPPARASSGSRSLTYSPATWTSPSALSGSVTAHHEVPEVLSRRAPSSRRSCAVGLLPVPGTSRTGSGPAVTSPEH